ncbi:MAG TPA: ATP-dependent DNA helicase [Bacillota bacterium]|nr:ATP-dependent DNA helicase [Bacillota bacterium]
MAVIDAVKDEFPELNEDQLRAISTTEGPLLVVAGPGSGKTLVLVVRTLNLLLQGLAEPREILLCTFTEKAAFELRDRLSYTAKKLGYQGDLSELLVGTIHGICNNFILRYRHRTPLGNNYEVLDDLTQLLFIFDHFDEIIGDNDNGCYLTRWNTRWTAIEGARTYFNKITEELIDPEKLIQSESEFAKAIGRAYINYCAKLIETNRIDFAHQQKVFLELLQDSEVERSIINRIKYIMVDEYQDTNYIQEQILFKLAGSHKNLCVVGDEDQSIYRFRGSTVRNILEFPSYYKNCPIITLSINYRSHEKIISSYNKFMSAWDWSNPSGEIPFRYEKTVVPNPEVTFPDYPAVFAIWGENKKDEAQRVADLILFLKKHRVIEDESQVALLLHSVRLEHSGHYLQALADKGIAAFCPRARAFFENEEVRLMVACFALLLGYHGSGRGELSGSALKALACYVDDCLIDLARGFSDSPLVALLRHYAADIENLAPGESLDLRLADYFYHFIAHEPFASFAKNENRARNLATFSQLLSIFQNYYHYTVITARNREQLRFHFFNSFMRLLYEGGINEYEDVDQPFPKGHVQVMTIHQAKGLEFPVVIVGSLSTNIKSRKDVDRVLQPYYHRPLFEPLHKITGFDRMRLHYVAFSRAEKILVLTGSEEPKRHFYPIWQNLPQWPYMNQELLASLFFRLRQRSALKKSYSFTGDLKVYETCPRQYQFFRHYEFTPSRSAEIFFGALVHQTIEDIHRFVLGGRGDEIDEELVRNMFDFNYNHLLGHGIRPIGKKQKEEAFNQVMNYVLNNREEMKRVIETEVDVSVEKDDYILVGKIDLLLGNDGRLELLDFKSQKRPSPGDSRLDNYQKQLCIYAHILEQRYSKKPDRLLLYWTGEPIKEDALMIFPYQPELVEEAGRHFDKVVSKIMARDFEVKTMPEKKVCAECDLREYCLNEGTLKLKSSRKN